MKYLDATIEGIHHIDAVVVVDLQSGRQLKVSQSGASLAEVVQKPAFAVEDLHNAQLAVDDVKMSFGIEADPFRAKHPSCPISELPDGIAKAAGAVEDLNAKVHGIHYDQVRTVQP